METLKTDEKNTILSDETWLLLKGNNDYMISDRLRIYKRDTKEIVSHAGGETKFNVSLFNLPMREYDKMFLWRITNSRFYLHPGFLELINKLTFVNDNRGNTSEFVPIFEEPQYLPFDKRLRFFPGCTYLLSSDDGDIYYLTKDLKLNKKDIMNVATVGGHPIIHVSANLRYLARRVIAYTWCIKPGTERVLDIIQNDGNKLNINSRNITVITEHVKNDENVKKTSFYPGVARPVKIRNIETKEVLKFDSISLASYYIYRSRMSYTNIELKPGKIWKGENGYFEIKYQDDLTDWVYDELPKDAEIRSSTEMDKNELKLPRKFLKVSVPGKFIKVFKSLEDLFIDFLGVDRTLGNYRKYRELILEKYPNAEITIEGGKQYEAKNYKTGEEVEENNLALLADKIKTTKSSATKYCKLGKMFNGWYIRLKNPFVKVPWPEHLEEELPANTTTQYEITNTNDPNDKKTFASFRKLANFFGCSRTTIKPFIGETTPFKGYIIKELGKTRQDLSTNNPRALKTGEYIRNHY